jgi:hypothetical protein
MSLVPYAGHDRPETANLQSDSTNAAELHRIDQLETENRRLRASMRAMEAALRCAAKVLGPYANRSIG